MKLFIILFITFIFIINTFEQILPLEEWFNLNVNGMRAMTLAREGAELFGTMRNKTFTLIRVTRAQARDELDGLIIRVKRRIDFLARTFNCLRSGGCVRHLRFIVIRYPNRTRITDVFLL
uniref:Uncharacterized protein n=1 Tax=Strongyloides stercoralis TaxID=6248 RepID=A0A0K0DZS8_STRER